MRKIFAPIISLLVVASFSTLATTPVQAYISTYSWIAPLYRGYDEFYGTSVTAYRTGTTAQLLVGVYNDWYGYPNITVTAVKVWFDWNVNYSSTETPYVMEPDEQHNFMINFTVPSTDVASNLIPHKFKIYVEFTYDTLKDYWTYSPWEMFAVYSEEQADARELHEEIKDFRYMYPVFISSGARTSWFKAQMEFRVGEAAYRHGDFLDAKTHYETARSLYYQSIDNEAEKGIILEDALVSLMNSTAHMSETLTDLKNPLTNVMNSMVETSRMQAQAFLILSVGIFAGMILIGIGVVIYALAKRKIASSTATTAS